MKKRETSSFTGLKPASATASRAAKGASRKRDTKAEVVLRRELWARGLRYRVDVQDLPGRPDVVLVRARIAVFCDGDFWHGRNLEARLSRLERGHNAPYWVAKISANVARDRRTDAALTEQGWLVLRFWETDVLPHPAIAAATVVSEARKRLRIRRKIARP